MKKNCSRVWSGMLLCAISGTLSLPVAAAPLSFLNQTITASIPAKDIPELRKTIGEVLNNSRNQESTEWHSSESPRQRPIEMKLTPLQTTQTQKAGTCRLLHIETSKAKASENWQFWFCQQPNGSWKASGSTVPH